VRRRLDARTTLQVYRAGGEDHNQHMGIFTRHRQIALQVWSGETGYPGDPDYLDFHKRFFRSGLRYWRVTDNKADMQWKQPYVPEWAENRAKAHAAHFVEILEATARHHLSDFEKPPTICLPFDTELFGHWWFEGPLFVEHVLRGIHQSHLLSATTAGERYDMVHPDCEVALPESSWGRNGNHDVWMNPDVQWTWEKEYQLERRIRMLLDKHRAEPWDATMRRLIMNALREMLLAQASDWQFLISTFSSREYAQMRFHNHAADAMRLANAAERYAVSQDLLKSDAQLLEACEKRNGVLEADLNHYLSSHA
jgi:1,4-alpha-glucan branching enzyme